VTQNQDCQQCGRCCDKWGWGQTGIPEDIIPWILENRKDILQHVSVTLKNGKRRNGRDILIDDLPYITRISYWVDPMGRTLTSCPFFWRADDGLVYCKIHDTKPKVCIGFAPWNEGIRDYALNCPACRNPAP
jgi:Fe-S-cluster containining protein